MASVSSYFDSFSIYLCVSVTKISKVVKSKGGGVAQVREIPVRYLPQIVVSGVHWQDIIEVVAACVHCILHTLLHTATPRWAAMKNVHDLPASYVDPTLWCCAILLSRMKKTCRHVRAKPLLVGN